MNRLQLFPQSGTNNDVLREWLSYDPKVRPGLELPDINALNWDAMLGLTLATVVSGCFWAVIGLTIAQVWK